MFLHYVFLFRLGYYSHYKGEFSVHVNAPSVYFQDAVHTVLKLYKMASETATRDQMLESYWLV